MTNENVLGAKKEPCTSVSSKTPSPENQNNAAQKKKKRPRQRVRSRNKAVVLAAANANCNQPPPQAEIVIKDIQEVSVKKPDTARGVIKNSKNFQEHILHIEKPRIQNQQQEQSTLATNIAMESSNNSGTPNKTREQILAEREAKKLSKQAKKVKGHEDEAPKPNLPVQNCAKVENVVKANITAAPAMKTEKSREQIMAEREAKKQAKQASKLVKTTVGTTADGAETPDITKLTQQLKNIKIDESTGAAATATTVPDDKKKTVLSKAERRAIQDAQRAAKAQKHTGATPSKTTALAKEKLPQSSIATAIRKSPSPDKSITTPNRSSASPTKATKTNDCKVKLFNHIESARHDVSLFVNNSKIHPSIVQLGEQYAKRTVVGSNARCIAFLGALKEVIKDFETPPKKEFTRSLEVSITNCIEHLQKCRPLAVSVTNAYKHMKHVLTQLPTDRPESELKENLCHFIDTYIENQIEKAAQAISSSMQEKISNGDVILTFGCSSLINYIFEVAQQRKVDFRVIVVDSRPFCEGQELLRRLTAKEIPCTYVLINAVGFVMPEVTKVLLGAHALLSNGYVMARTGTAQVALVARSFNVPVLVCCETHKFSERFQTDAIVYNELGNPDDLIQSDKCCLTNWQAKHKMTPLNLMYDITPPELVTAVVTEVSILPCTSVPVILRIKPTEIGYYN